jgi:hypothetical protein
VLENPAFAKPCLLWAILKQNEIMKRLFENSTFSLDYDESKSLIVQHWFGDLDEKQYKENMLILVEWVQQLPPVHFNIVYPNLTFPIVPDLQDWTAENVFIPTKRKGLKKAAFIVPQEVYEQIIIEFLSIEQTMEESQNLFETKYFISEQEAFQWFNT